MLFKRNLPVLAFSFAVRVIYRPGNYRAKLGRLFTFCSLGFLFHHVFDIFIRVVIFQNGIIFWIYV